MTCQGLGAFAFERGAFVALSDACPLSLNASMPYRRGTLKSGSARGGVPRI
jgi:hypothetical protein